MLDYGNQLDKIKIFNFWNSMMKVSIVCIKCWKKKDKSKMKTNSNKIKNKKEKRKKNYCKNE
jgi:hypothetical protein